jgi:glutamate formiminotransferase
VTATAVSNGNSESNRETAFTVAEMNAKAKLRRFIHEDISSTQVTNTISKNIEKANDRIKQRIANGEEVAMSDTEASKDTNWAVRENTNDITRHVTEIVRVNASGILRGIKTVDERIVDRQTVQVTIRWDRSSDTASQFFNKKFTSSK